MKQDILGNAISDFYHNKFFGKLWIHNKYGPKEEMPVEVYFRDETEMSELELMAIELCKDSVLDIGAGAGSHALLLQHKNIDVTALEISQKASTVMRLRGVEKVLETDIFEYAETRFDTLLLLMNGIGLTGTISMLRVFLQHAKKLLKPNGQLLFDSSDVAYLYEGNLPKTEDYYGEISYSYQYRKQKSDWFKWLYIDQQLLIKIAAEEGWKIQILAEDEYDQYLAKGILENK